MSRFQRFVHALASGYVLLATNILFTLVQWPLVIRYLTPKEFGLWAAVTSLSINLQLLIDLGISGSVSRILIDHKDDKKSAVYGTTIKTAALVMLAQGLVIAIVGSGLSIGLPHWMKIDAGLQSIFRNLMIGQCVLFGLAFLGRINQFILQAHHRSDVCNYAQIGGFLVNLLALWIGLELKWGLYSLLLATGTNIAFSILTCLIATSRLRLFPSPGYWGRADWRKFREIFSYANDIFLLSVGQVLVGLSQAPLITLQLGLEANAVWSTMTKTFLLAQQMITRAFDFSSTPFAEMMVRCERERLLTRFREVVVLTASLGVVVCLGVALGNGSFVELWMSGKFSWPVGNDLLMALFILINTSTRCHIGLAGLTKQIGPMKFVYVAEGLVFLMLGYFLARPLGLTGIILAGICANLTCSGCYGWHRTVSYFSVTVREVVFGWHKRPACSLVLLLGVAAVLWVATISVPTGIRLTICVVLFGPVGLWCLWWLGLPVNLRTELVQRIQRFRHG